MEGSTQGGRDGELKNQCVPYILSQESRSELKNVDISTKKWAEIRELSSHLEHLYTHTHTHTHIHTIYHTSPTCTQTGRLMKGRYRLGHSLHD